MMRFFAGVLPIGCLLITTGCSVGGGHGLLIAEGEVAKNHLLDFMRPVRTALYVEMAGTSRYVGLGQETEAFVLRMGPQGKVLCRRGHLTFFCDGTRLGGIDSSTVPPTQSVRPPGTDLASDLYMGVHQVGGPSVFMLARLLDGPEWLSHIVGDDPDALFEERQLPRHKVEICVTFNLDQEHRFIFTDERGTPVAHSFRSAGPESEPVMEVTFRRVRYPSSVQDIVFKPYTIEQGTVVGKPWPPPRAPDAMGEERSIK